MMNRDRITRSRTTYRSSGTTLGMGERLERTLLYPLSAVLAIFTPLGWLIGLIVFLIEKNRNVRSHALQAAVIFGVLSIVSWLAGLFSHIFLIGLVFLVIGWIVFWVIIAAAVLLTIGAWLSANYRLPYIGNIIDGLFARWI